MSRAASWTSAKLEEVAKTATGGTPARSNPTYFAGTIPWVKSGELDDNSIYDTEEHLSSEALRESSAKIFPKGTVLVALYGATVGKTAILETDAATNQAVCAIFVDDRVLDHQFLRYFLMRIRPDLLGQRYGGAQPNISQTIIRNTQVHYPSIREQRQIATVLSTVQRAIERQERLIALTAALKKALMHKLFTGGTRGEPPKQTEIGSIPKSWSVAPLGSVTTTVYRYPTYYSIDYLATGVPEIRGELLLSSGEIERNLDKYRFISQEAAARFPRVRLEVGDLVMSVRGTMGKLGIVRKQQQGAVITANLIRLAPNRSLIDPEYFRWSLMRPAFLAALDAASPQTTIKTITAPALKNLEIPLPSIAEQRTIASALELVETLHGHHIRQHTLLDELFRTLLQQLMTSQIRVHDLDLSALEETEWVSVGAV